MVSSIRCMLAWWTLWLAAGGCAHLPDAPEDSRSIPVNLIVREAWIVAMRHVVAQSAHPVRFATEPMSPSRLRMFVSLNQSDPELQHHGTRDSDRWMQACFEQSRPTWPAGLFSFMFAPEAPSRWAHALLSEHPEVPWQSDGQIESNSELITLSPLGLSEDRRVAIIYYSTGGMQACASGSLLILNYVENCWVIRVDVHCWIS